MTVSGSFLGTPAYMSPEQIAVGRISIDHRTDVYSLGAVLYELLTLKRPFPGESRDQILSGILQKEPRPPRRINPRTPIDLETICLKAMEKDPDRRYASAVEMAEDLRSFLQRGLISARRAGPVRRTVKLVRRHPVISMAIAAGVVVLLLVGLVWQQASGRSSEAAMRAVADARYFLSQGDYVKGLECTDEALALVPELADARIMRARLLIKLRRYPEAVQQAREILADDPNDWMGHLILALVAETHEVPELSAEEHLQAVEDHAPETAEVFYLRGMLAESADEAIELLDQALARDPGHAEALSERSRRYVDKKNFQAALKDAERLAALRPRSAQGRSNVARIYRRLRDPHRALEEFDAAVALDPDDPITYGSRSHVYRDMSRFDEALRDINRAIELDPEYAGYYHSRALIYFWDLSDYEKAIADAERAIELNPDTEAYETLSRAFLKMDMEEEAHATIDKLRQVSAGWKDRDRLFRALLDAAIVYRSQGDAERAVSVAGEMIELEPDRHWGYVFRAWDRRKLGDRAGMREDCDRIVRLDSQDPDELLQISYALNWACDRPELSSELLTKVIDLAPHWADSHIYRASVLSEGGRCDEALADYDRAIELAPRSGIYASRAQLYADMERFGEALQDWDRFFELGYDNRYVRSARAETLARMSRVDEALADLDYAIAAAPKDGWGYQERALLLERLGRVDEALVAAEQAIDVEPTSALGYWRRFYLKLSLSVPCEEVMADLQKWQDLAGNSTYRNYNEPPLHFLFLHRFCPHEADYNSALKMAHSAVELWPRDHYAWDALGLGFYRTGRYVEAREALLKSLDLQWLPYPHTLFTIAMVEWRLGDRAGARSHYDQALERMDATWPHWPVNILIKEEAANLLGIGVKSSLNTGGAPPNVQ
jgi:tetratricopeptide (TPR) repeat protein